MLSAGRVCGVAPAGGVQGVRGYGVWCVVCGVWCVVCGVWCVVCGVWCVVCGVWCVGLMLCEGFKDCECLSERISWLINDWSWLD